MKVWLCRHDFLKFLCFRCCFWSLLEVASVIEGSGAILDEASAGGGREANDI